MVERPRTVEIDGFRGTVVNSLLDFSHRWFDDAFTATPCELFVGRVAFNMDLNAEVLTDEPYDKRLSPDDLAMLAIASGLRLKNRKGFGPGSKCVLHPCAAVSPSLVDLRDKQHVFDVASVDSFSGEVAAVLHAVRCEKTCVFENGFSFSRRSRTFDRLNKRVCLPVYDVVGFPHMNLAVELVAAASGAPALWYDRLYSSWDLPSILRKLKERFVDGFRD